MVATVALVTQQARSFFHFASKKMMEFLKQPWPWYVAGAIVGLTVPALLLLGNKHFGISANLRHTCAACLPANIKFFKYDWKKEIWNFFFCRRYFDRRFPRHTIPLRYRAGGSGPCAVVGAKELRH